MEGSVLNFLKAEWKVSDTEPLVLRNYSLIQPKMYIDNHGLVLLKKIVLIWNPRWLTQQDMV
jgi:hypothetical protein